MEDQIPLCPRCKTKLVKIQNKLYWGCPKWLPNNVGCEGTIWWPDSEKKRTVPNVILSYKVQSRSNPGNYYQVKIHESGDIYCGCIASDMNKFCFHKQKTVADIEAIIKKIKQANYHENGNTKTVARSEKGKRTVVGGN